MNSTLSTAQPALLKVVIDEINAQGNMPFARYMALALYHPQWGYYRNARPTFGADGDFVTAPELSPLFGQTLARWCYEKWLAFGSKRPWTLLEFGAGSGRLAATLLKALAELDALPDSYSILELSAELKTQQLAHIHTEVPALAQRVCWLTQLPTPPFSGLILANEVLDAMPVHLFQQEDTIKEVFVTHKNNQLALCVEDPLSPGLVDAVKNLTVSFPKGYRSEINLSIEGWMHSMSDCLERGAALLIDYGFLRPVYYHPQRTQGTLMCHFRHQAHSNPLIHLGNQDITAHVDFTQIQDAAVKAGLAIENYGTQAQFLLDFGLLDIFHTHYQAHASQPMVQHRLSQQVKKLTLPSEMGELFKVLTLTKV